MENLAENRAWEAEEMLCCQLSQGHIYSTVLSHVSGTSGDSLELESSIVESLDAFRGSPQPSFMEQNWHWRLLISSAMTLS